MREMKDSGTNWLGCIPSCWTLSSIGQIYSERRKKVSDTEYQPLSVTMQGIVPQLSTAAKTDAHDDRKLVLKGDFAINSRSDRRGSCGISPYDGSVSLINTILAPKGEMNPIYYNWLFHTSEFASEFYKWGHGIVDDLWTTNWGDMKRIAIPVPPLAEQLRIANFLDEKCKEIDNVIEKTKSSIEEYGKLKQSIILEAVSKGIHGERQMKKSGIDWLSFIPTDWYVRKIGSILTYIGGYAFKSDCFISESTNQVLRIGNIKDGNLSLASSPVYISDDIAAEASGARIMSDSIIFTMTGTKGKGDYFYTCFINQNILPINLFINQRVGMFLPKSDIYLKYIYYLLKNNLLRQRVFLYETGTANQGNIGIEAINQIRVPLPSFQEQTEIAEYLDHKCSEIESLISSKKQIISELVSYKKSLIYEYVTGKKEVVV